ncbi:MAG: nucleotidyltransferase family protein [Oscillospiraceae bacterium]|nr:nucleotidyltransferase family protein [Oscillospiraceae bacterium]
MQVSAAVILLLRSALTGEQLSMECRESISSLLSDPALFTLSLKHSVANVVSVGLFNNGFNVESTKFEQVELQAAISDAQTEADFESIKTVFQRHHIDFIPLKGVVLKQYYPDTAMRTCGDIDILIHKEDTERAVDALVKECGFISQSYNHHDVALTSEAGVTLELHFSLEYDVENLDAVLARAWEYAVKVDGSEYRFADDFFFFFILSHLAHHFYPYGCGIRFFMDLWIIRHRMGLEFNDAVKELCRQAGIEKFSEAALQLSETWFSGLEHSELTKAMEEYIFACGTFGNTDNVAAVGGEKKKGRLMYNLRRMLLPYEKLKLIYPEMKPIQFPVYEIKRWVKLLDRGLSRRRSMSKKSISDEKKEKVQQLMEQLEIR